MVDVIHWFVGTNSYSLIAVTHDPVDHGAAHELFSSRRRLGKVVILLYLFIEMLDIDSLGVADDSSHDSCLGERCSHPDF